MGLAEIAPAVAHLECSGRMHSVLWRAGVIDLLDHPDPAGERALIALGGAPCPCLELLDAWQRAAADPRALVLGPRAPSFTARDTEAEASATIGWLGSGPDVTEADPVEALIDMSGPLAHRLVVTAAAALAGRRHEPALRAQLHAALYGRVLVALGRWLGELPDLELAMIEPEATASLTRDGRLVRAELPFHWLVGVWGAGLTTVADRFTLAATPIPPTGWNLRSVDQLMSVNTCTLSVS